MGQAFQSSVATVQQRMCQASYRHESRRMLNRKQKTPPLCATLYAEQLYGLAFLLRRDKVAVLIPKNIYNSHPLLVLHFDRCQKNSELVGW